MTEGLKSGVHKIVSVNINFKISTGDYNSGKKNVSLSLKEDNTNLNILKIEHALIDNILKLREIMQGYKDIDIKKQK